MIGHCIICGKGYKKWKWFTHHYNKEHPEYNKPWGEDGWPLTIRVVEVAEAMNKEAEAFAKLPKVEWR